MKAYRSPAPGPAARPMLAPARTSRRSVEPDGAQWPGYETARCHPLGDMMAISVLLADDHLSFCQSLRAFLEREGFRVVGEAADGREAVRLARALRPDVAVLDVSMPLLNGVDAAREIQGACPRTRTILLTMHAEDQYVLQALKGGVQGYVLKKQPVMDLIQAVQEGRPGRTGAGRRPLGVAADSTPATRETTRALRGAGRLLRGGTRRARPRRARAPRQHRHLARDPVEGRDRGRHGLGGRSARRSKAARDVNPERGALSDSAGHGDGPAERVHELLHDAQPEPDTAGAAGAALADLVEGLEDRVQVVGRDARAGVADLDHDPTGASSRVRHHGDPPRLRELDRVVDQIVDDLLQLHAVGLQHREVRLDRDREAEARVAEPARMQGLDLGEQRGQGEALDPERDMDGAETCEVEQVGDQAELQPRVALEGGDP